LLAGQKAARRPIHFGGRAPQKEPQAKVGCGCGRIFLMQIALLKEHAVKSAAHAALVVFFSF
jgi:hypothetical protein